ncbi:MAG TPA: SAM-dependent methyltransferase, partial [Nocardioides sp.]
MTTITAPLPQALPLPSGVRAAVARRILQAVAGRVPVDVRLPDGSPLAPAADGGPGGRPAAGDRPVLELVRPEALFRRIADHPKIGIGEGYMAGDWRAGEGTDLAEVLLPFAERMTTAVPPVLARLRRLVDRPLPADERNSLTGSRRNIEAHYDLS